WQESEKVGDIDEYIEKLHEAAPLWPMTVGWIDCLTRGRHLGRGILFKGRWAEPSEAPPVSKGPPRLKVRLAVPFDFPAFALSPLTVRAFNEAIYRAHLGRV